MFLAQDSNLWPCRTGFLESFIPIFLSRSCLSFDVDNFRGSIKPKEPRQYPEKLIEREQEIASFDSISYLLSPDSL